MVQPGDAAGSARFRTSRTAHAAMVGSLLVYAGVVHVLQNTGWMGAAARDAVAVVRWASSC